MKLVIFGSRSIVDLYILERVIEIAKIDLTTVTEIVSGGAPGVDTCAIHYAEVKDIPCTVFYADWKTYKKQAGMIRNAQMAKYADQGLALWDGKSPGTKNMIDLMKGRCQVFCIIDSIIKGDESHGSTNQIS